MRGMTWQRSPGQAVVEGLERRLLLTDVSGHITTDAIGGDPSEPYGLLGDLYVDAGAPLAPGPRPVETAREPLLTGSYDVGASLISPEWFQRLPASLPEAEGSLDEGPERGVGHMRWGGQVVEVSRGEWIVQLTSDAIDRVGSVAGAAALFGSSQLNIEVVRGLGMAGQLLLRAPGADVSAVVDWMGHSDSVAYFEPNAIRTIEELPDDPRFFDQWNMHDSLWDADIDAPDAWDVYTGNSDVVVAVIDTGVDYAHPDLDGNIWVNPGEIPGNSIDDDGNGRVDDIHGWDFGDGDCDPMDHHSHGTHVAGILGAEGGNGIGVAGVNWSASIMALKYTDNGGSGFADDSVAAINYATMMRRDYGVNVRVINASYGEYTFIQSERDAIQAAGEAGILFVAAAGERDPHPVDNDLMPHYPSCYALDNIISVAATDGAGSLASYSDWGASSVDLAAPGGDWIEVLSTVPGGGYGEKIGTSMATPHVTGVAALAWSMAPTAGYEQIRTAILDGVAPEPSLQGKTVTGGRLNAFGTVEALRPRIQGTSWDDLDGDGSRDLGEPGLQGQTVYLDLNDNAVFEPDGEILTIDSTDVPKSISDFWLFTTTSDLTVSGVGSVADVNVALDITHYRDFDLDVHLVSPLGTKVELFTDVGSNGDHFNNTILDDEAPLPITSGVPPFREAYQPEGLLADFDGEDPNGTWTLEIVDDTSGYIGTLNSWSITIATTAGEEPGIQTDKNGRYAFAGLAPGSFVVRQVGSDYKQTFPSGTPELGLVQVVRDGQGGVDGLDSASCVQGSPDGSHLYATGASDDALSVYVRDPATGELTFVQVVKDGQGGVDGLDGTRSVALSSDGRHVYATGQTDDALAVFGRDEATGALSFVQAVKNGQGGVDGLDGVISARVSPDGRHVYAAGTLDDALVVFGRDVFTGELTFVQTLRDGQGGLDGLDGASSLAVSPDGGHVYATSTVDGALAVFSRDAATGELTFAQVLKDGQDGVDGLGGASSLAVSPDGRHVYATGISDDALAVFSRDTATGQLTFVQVLKDGQAGVNGLNGANSVAVSPDGTRVYSTGNYEHALTAFTRDGSSGELSFSQVVRDGQDGVDGLEGAGSVIVSRDGGQVYARGWYDDALVVFDAMVWPAHEVDVASGQAVEGVDFGSRLPQTEIRGRKWNDLDGDGVWEDGEPGLPEWTIYLDLNGNGVWDGSGSSGPTTAASTDVPISIPDPGTVTSDLSVSGAAGALTDLDVTLDISHGWDSDVDAYLISPLGTRVELFTGVGGMGENFSGTTLDDEATLAITSGFAPFSGRYRPAGSLAALDGEDPNGTWVLEITDTEEFIAGTLNSWSITFTVEAGEPYRLTDQDGMYVFDDLDPGTYIVREVLEPGWQQTAPASGYHEVDVVSGQAVEGVDFGNRLPRTEIRGRKWNDLDGDGVWEDGEPGLPEWTIYLDLNGNGAWDGSGSSGPTTAASTDVPISIPDLDTVTSDLSVSGAAGALTDLDVTLDITHGWDSDVDAYLISPLGTRVELFTGVGGMGEDFSGTTLDDEAASAITSGSAPFSGRYRPAGSLAALDGEDPNGTWLLEITDTEEYLAGTLNSWSITFTVEAGEPYRLTDQDGIYVFDDLSPGTYTVREVGESGWEQTCPAAGFREVTIVAGQVVEEVDFGNCVPQTGFTGRKWNDLNGDGAGDGEPGLPGWTIYVDLNENGSWDSGGDSDPMTFSSSDVPLAIPYPGPVTSELTVSGVAGGLTDVDVTLDISHNWDSDLNVYLISPLGTRVELFTGVGGMGENFTGTTLDDEATLAISSGSAPFSGRYRPEGALAALDGEDPNGTWLLELSDVYSTISGTLNSWSITFTVEAGEPYRLTDQDGMYVFDDLSPGTYTVREVGESGWEQTCPAAGFREVTIVAGQVVEGVDFGNCRAVAARHVFYNNSVLDGENALAGADDDDAIDPGKQALRPGQTATSANLTCYSRGINGIMVDMDIEGLAGPPGAGDFAFKIGNSDDPNGWADAPAPANDITADIRLGAGVGGVDRITIVWSDGGIAGCWLQVKVLPTDNTGLPEEDVFYFGSLPGDANCDSAADHLDYLAIKRTFGVSGEPGRETCDFDVDGDVDYDDYVVMRDSFGESIGPMPEFAAAALLAQDDRPASAPVPVGEAGAAAIAGTADAVGSWASGDGSAGGDFRFRLNALPGDVDGSGEVRRGERIKVRRKSNTVTGDPDYSVFYDVDGNGEIRSSDTIKVRRLSNTELPAGEPVAPPAAPAAPSIDAALIAAALKAARQPTDRDLLSPLRADVLSLAEIVPLPI